MKTTTIRDTLYCQDARMGSGLRRQISSVYLAPRAHPRIEFDLPEGGLVAVDILLQQSEQSLGLLRAEVNALKVADLDLTLTLLLHGAKNEEEIPYIHSHLHAVGIGFPVVGGIGQLDIGLWRSAHGKKCNDFGGRKGRHRHRNPLRIALPIPGGFVHSVFVLTKSVRAAASFWRIAFAPRAAKGHGRKLLC